VVSVVGSRSSDVTSVGVTRGGKWRCHPYFSAWKKLTTLLVLNFAVSSRFSFFLFIFAHRCHFLLISHGCHPTPLNGVTSGPFYLCDLLCPLFFVNSAAIFFIRVSPPWRVSRRAVRPPLTPSSDATVTVDDSTLVDERSVWAQREMLLEDWNMLFFPVYVGVRR